MEFPTGGGWWAFLGTLVIGFLLGQFINLTTPLVKYALKLSAGISIRWFATRTRASLEKRISKLEKRLAEAEKYPALDPVQNQMLWDIKSLKILIINVAAGIILFVYFGVLAVAKPDNPALMQLGNVVLFIIAVTVIETLIMRYHKDFRWIRQAAYRENLRTAIKDLKELRENWDADMPFSKPQ